jgi:hypothetical protein
MYLDNLRKNNDAIFAGDTEFYTKLLLPENFTTFKELKKVICHTDFVLTQLATPDSEVKTYEHPDIKAGLLPTWRGNCVFSEFLGYQEIDKPKSKKVKTFNIAYLFYFSAYDIFGLFRDKNTQINLAKQLLGGRVLQVKSFPNHLRTGVFIEVPGVDKNGNECLEVREIAIKPFDAKGYTPAGVSGLNKTFETWGVKFTNKNWLKFFDIANFKSEYLNTVEMIEVLLEDGTSKWMSKHEIVVEYATGDGLKEMFTLYENVHINGRNTLDKMGYSEYDLKNFQTIGNISNQVGVAACLSGLNMNMTKEDETQISKYFYPSSAYSLLDNCFATIRELLNIDGGFCKYMKPTEPTIHDLTIDNDLAGAYAEAMRSLPYCVGVPCVISYPYDRENRANFYKEFTKLRNKDCIYDGAWVARISTTEPLTFKQDLIFSKIFGATDFEKSQIEDEDGFFVIDDSKVNELNDLGILAMIPDGSFQLLNNEIISGIITHDILQFIELFWSKSEKKELFSKLRIDTMIFYNKKFLLSPDEFKNEFSKLDDSIVFNFDNGTSIKDKRKPIWCIVPTDKGWFGDLTNIRNDLKSLASIAKKLIDPAILSEDDLAALNGKLSRFLKVPNLSDNDRNDLQFMLDCVKNKHEQNTINITKLNELAAKYKCEQNGFKCVNNSSYGVTGSALWQQERPSKVIDKDGNITEYARPKIGNMVFAQNVTARVRLGAYCMCKASNGYSVITDGTQSNINEFWFWNWKGYQRSVFGSQELWNLSRYNTAKEIDPKGFFNVKLAPLGNMGKWEVIVLNESNKTVTISNGDIEITGNEENWKQLDIMSYQHAKNLFGELDIFKNDVMKYASKDLYKGAAFQSQANYLFEKFFKSDKDVMGEKTDLKTKARGYNLSKCVHYSPDLSDEKFKHPYEEMIKDIYYKDQANIYLKAVYSPQLLGIDDFNKSENITNDYIERGFFPHSPTFRSSRPSPFSLSMFKWNTRKQYEVWDKKVNSWKLKTGFGVELIFLTDEIINNRQKLKYSEVVNKIQTMIDDNISLHTLDKRMIEKLSTLQHPQYFIEENLSCELI